MKHLFHVRLAQLWLEIGCLLITAGSGWVQLTNQLANPAMGTTIPRFVGARVFGGRLYFQAATNVPTLQRRIRLPNCPSERLVARILSGRFGQQYTHHSGREGGYKARARSILNRGKIRYGPGGRIRLAP